jgi:hypothetical protein
MHKTDVTCFYINLYGHVKLCICKTNTITWFTLAWYGLTWLYSYMNHVIHLHKCKWTLYTFMKCKQGVCHTVGLCIYMKKYLKASIRRIMETQIFHNAKIIIFKKSSKRNQNPSRIYNSITNLKFQHKPKNIIFQKSAYKNRPIIIT